MTIREQVSEKLAEESAAAAIKQHERMIETLYVDSDGDVFWDAQPDSNTWLQRDDGSLASLYRTGTGSCTCNCDACAAGENPADWAGDDASAFADELQAKLDQIAPGFFADEQAPEPSPDN
jgi:hypothetical protein